MICIKNNVIKFTKEEEFVESIIKMLKNIQHEVKIEIPFFYQCIDIVSKNKNDYHLIEAKISNWRKALQQCEQHFLYGDYIYIAIASKRVSPTLLTIAKDRGIGIIHHVRENNSIKIVLKPKQNVTIWPELKEKLFNNMLGIKDE